MLTKTPLAESLTSHIILYKHISPNSLQLTLIVRDQIYFWQCIHPVWNPIIKPVQAAFLQGAIYVFYGGGKPEKAEELEHLPHTPHYDDWEVRELVALGALDNEFRKQEALKYFKEVDDKHWEYHANEQALHNSANNILHAMEEDELDDLDPITDDPSSLETQNSDGSAIMV